MAKALFFMNLPLELCIAHGLFGNGIGRLELSLVCVETLPRTSGFCYKESYLNLCTQNFALGTLFSQFNCTEANNTVICKATKGPIANGFG